MVIVLRKLIIFDFQIVVFDKQQINWLQTRKRKLQEEIQQKSLDEFVKELWESRSQLLYW